MSRPCSTTSPTSTPSESQPSREHPTNINQPTDMSWSSTTPSSSSNPRFLRPPASPFSTTESSSSFPSTVMTATNNQSDLCLPLVSLSWNVEGMKRYVFSLRNIIDESSPDLVFLSEAQISTSDLPHCMSFFKGEYCAELNSEDKYNADCPMTKSKSNGGTMVLWKRSLDQYITTFQAASPSFLPIIFHPPGAPVSAHIAIYLPTAGKEADYAAQHLH